MFFNRRARFGLQPTLVIQNQYLNPHAKTALYAVAIILLGFLSFVGGTVYQMIENTEIATVSLELPQNTSLYDIDYKPIYVMDNDYEYVYSGLIPFEWNPSAEEHAKEIDCLAKNIYFEARNENIDGKLAVGLVTINRVLDPEFPETICDVVWQKRRHPNTKKWVAQFSWTWDGKNDKPLNRAKWYEARRTNEKHTGFKVLVEEETGRILGAHLLGTHAEEVINLFGFTMRNNLPAASIKTMIYAYPTSTTNISYMV